MKRLLSALMACLLALTSAQAVLKERDLSRTLGVLRAELTSTFEKQQIFKKMYEQQGAAQHQQLVSYMNQCEQIGLMVYSQSRDNTFDMAYACQQAVNLYRSLDVRNGRTLPYDKIILRMQQQIEQYDALIASLKSIPPIEAADADQILTQSDSILLNAIDSLETHMDSMATTDHGPDPHMPHLEAPEESHEPLYLSGQQLEDRRVCLKYATVIRANLQEFLESLEAESSYYKSVQEKVKDLNNYAQANYRTIQDHIFREGGTNYFRMLTHLPQYVAQAGRSITTKYRPFAGHSSSYSEWRGIPVLFISLFLIIYLSAALLISYIILHWLLPKRWRGNAFKERRRMLTCVLGIGLFAIMVMVVRAVVHRNFIQMSTSLIIDIAWLLEAIFLSLYIRLKNRQMHEAAIIYTPLMAISFVVILFRIVLIPDSVLGLIFPPILLAFVLWQAWVVRRHKSTLPALDVIYSYITLATMVFACVAAWVGYTLLAVQLLVWWIIQLAAITSITCIYHLMELYEQRVLLFRVKPELKASLAEGKSISAASAPVLRDMKQGKYITRTWLYDFVNRALVPILAVLSVPLSIYMAAGIFEMTSICQKAFVHDFINLKDLIQVSLYKLCVVAELWFVFRYLNYLISNLYAAFRRQRALPNEVLNITLGRNVVAIVVWGLFFIVALVILNVPKSGISIVTAGLATGLGFAMQHLIENFFYGISLMTGRLRVGDYIECDGISGKVESITYQSTQIITADGCVISFLNSTLFSNNFKNLTRNHNYELVKIPVGVAYGTNVDQVRQQLVQALNEACSGETPTGLPLINPKQPITVAFADFGESSVDLLVCVWMLVEQKIPLTSRCRETIYNTLNANNVEIPFPQRDVHMR